MINFLQNRLLTCLKFITPTYALAIFGPVTSFVVQGIKPEYYLEIQILSLLAFNFFGLIFQKSKPIFLCYTILLFWHLGIPQLNYLIHKDEVESFQEVTYMTGKVLSHTETKTILLDAVIYDIGGNHFSMPKAYLDTKDIEGKKYLLRVYPGNSLEVSGVMERIDDLTFKPLERAYFYNLSSEIKITGRNRLFLELSERLTYHMDREHESIYKALVLADRWLMGKEIREKLSKLGIFHLFALSGLHVGLIILLIIFLSRLSALFIRRNQTGLWQKRFELIGYVAVFFYLLFIGFPVTALRAFTFFVFFKIAYRFLPKLDTLELAGHCILLLILFEPTLIANLSFQLSVSAVTVILALNSYRLYLTNLYRIPEIIDKIGFIFTASILINFFGWPLISIVNNQIALLSPLANIIHILLVAWIILPVCILLLPFLLISVQYFPPNAVERFLIEIISSLLDSWLAAINYTFDISENSILSVDPPTETIRYCLYLLMALYVLGSVICSKLKYSGN